MLKLSIKSTFENTTPEDVRWRVYFTASWFSPWNFAGNRRIHVTFVSLSFISCRIYEKWIFIISSRGYITCPDRWPGSQVPAGYKTLACNSAYISHLFGISCDFIATLTLLQPKEQRYLPIFAWGGAYFHCPRARSRNQHVNFNYWKWTISGSKYA